MPRVVVVGGGVLGTMHALEAVDRGHEVVQLERDAEPRSASVRNFGLVWVSGRAPGEELAAALDARRRWQALAERVPGVGFRPDGSLTIARHPAEVAVLEEVATRADAAERDLRLLDEAGARARNPAVRGPLLAALWCGLDAVVEPRAVLPAVRTELAASGRYRFVPGTPVVDVAGRGGSVTATDEQGRRHHGDAVVVCPGAELDGPLAPLLTGAPLRRCRLQMLETAPHPERLTTALADGDSLRYYPAFRTAALAGLPEPEPMVTQFRIQLLVAQRAHGGLTIGDTHEYDEPFDFALDERPTAHLLARAAEILGGPLPPVARRWAGVYTLGPEGTLCWRHRPEPGIVIVTGLAGRGMTLSPTVAAATLDELDL